MICDVNVYLSRWPFRRLPCDMRGELRGTEPGGRKSCTPCPWRPRRAAGVARGNQRHGRNRAGIECGRTRKDDCRPVGSDCVTTAEKSGGPWKRLGKRMRLLGALAAVLFPSSVLSQQSQTEARPADLVPRRYHLEFTSFENSVSNQFGHWAGGGLSLSYKWSDRLTTTGQILGQRRPGEVQPLLGTSTRIEWSPWFYTDLALSGGGPNDPAAFFPRWPACAIWRSTWAIGASG